MSLLELIDLNFITSRTETTSIKLYEAAASHCLQSNDFDMRNTLERHLKETLGDQPGEAQ